MILALIVAMLFGFICGGCGAFLVAFALVGETVKSVLKQKP